MANFPAVRRTANFNCANERSINVPPPPALQFFNAAVMSADKATATTSAADKPLGMRKNGKQWHAPKKAFRPTSGLTSYEKRAKERVAMAAMKAKEKEMKDEKEAERKQRIQNLKDKKAAKEEKERYEKMAEKMHKKRVERLKRKEKRNKLINS